MSSVTLIQKRHVPGRTQEKLYSLSVITAQYMYCRILTGKGI